MRIHSIISYIPSFEFLYSRNLFFCPKLWFPVFLHFRYFVATNATSTFRSIVSTYPGQLVLVSIQVNITFWLLWVFSVLLVLPYIPLLMLLVSSVHLLGHHSSCGILYTLLSPISNFFGKTNLLACSKLLKLLPIFGCHLTYVFATHIFSHEHHKKSLAWLAFMETLNER